LLSKQFMEVEVIKCFKFNWPKKYLVFHRFCIAVFLQIGLKFTLNDASSCLCFFLVCCQLNCCKNRAFYEKSVRLLRSYLINVTGTKQFCGLINNMFENYRRCLYPYKVSSSEFLIHHLKCMTLPLGIE